MPQENVLPLDTHRSWCAVPGLLTPIRFPAALQQSGLSLSIEHPTP